MYRVRLLKNTGFNGVDVAGVSVLLQGAGGYIELDAVDILSPWHLSALTVAGEPGVFDGIGGADFCIVYPDNTSPSAPEVGTDAWYTEAQNGVCYIVTAAEPVAPDTCRLHVVMDYYSTIILRGKSNFLTRPIEVTGGLTERYSFPPGFNTFGAYAEDDPLLVPQKPLKLVIHDFMDNIGAAYYAANVVVESMIDLTELANELDGNTLVGKTFTAADGSTTTQPYTQTPANRTNYYISIGEDIFSDATTSKGPIYSKGTKCYSVNNSSVQKALGLVQALDVKQALISCVAYPTQTNGVEVTIGDNGEVTAITGVARSIKTGIVQEYYDLSELSDKIKYERVFYGSGRRVGILTASGDRAEFNIEQVDAQNLNYVCDPRPDGAPYFRFKSYMGDSSFSNFFNGAVKGLQWENVPLVWEGKAGSYLDTVNFNAARETGAIKQNAAQNTGAASLIAGAAGGVLSAGGAIASGNIAGAIGGAISSGASLYTQYTNLQAEREVYAIERQNQLANFTVQQQVYVPEVSFPFNANIVRDFIGNGCLVYEYQYDDADIVRMNKILNMFGMKCTIPVTKEMLFPGFYATNLNNEPGYVSTAPIYIEAKGLQLSATMTTTTAGAWPRWFLQGLNAQLSNGVRIWHTLPAAVNIAEG